MGDVSNTLGDSHTLIWCSMSPWSIWHLLKKNRLKNEKESAEKLSHYDGSQGGGGGSGQNLFMVILIILS